MANNPFTSVSNFIGSALNDNPVTDALNRANDSLNNFTSDIGVGKALRSAGLLPGAIPLSTGFTEGNWASQDNQDWRVRLSVPAKYRSSPVLAPLSETNGLVFPYTPQIILENQANYNTMSPTHSNYPFYSYENSSVSAMTIIGEFFVENAQEGLYWVAAIHYLRSITKMAYGNSSDQGSPPPVVKLNGYGDFVFKNVPVVVNMFTVDLPNDVDYIQVPVGENGTWVPTRSQVSVVVSPTYSRSSVTEFSLDKFVNGGYIFDDKGFI